MQLVTEFVDTGCTQTWHGGSIVPVTRRTTAPGRWAVNVVEMIVAVVRFSLPKPMRLDEATTVFESSAPGYQTVDGLRRKHYLLSEDRMTAGGVYLWDSREHADRLYDDAWRTKLAARYGAAPTVEFFDSPVTVDADAITVG